jgi:hypothetical protein
MKQRNNELGRRLCAAVISYQMGIQSIDYTLKCHVPKEIDSSWGELAAALQIATAVAMDKYTRRENEE